MAEPVTNTGDPPPPTSSMLTTLTHQMTEALSKVQTVTMSTENLTALIGIKLDGSNYALWFQVVEIYISGKDKLDLSMAIFPNRRRPTHPLESGELTMPLSNGG